MQHEPQDHSGSEVKQNKQCKQCDRWRVSDALTRRWTRWWTRGHQVILRPREHWHFRVLKTKTISVHISASEIFHIHIITNENACLQLVVSTEEQQVKSKSSFEIVFLSSAYLLLKSSRSSTYFQVYIFFFLFCAYCADVRMEIPFHHFLENLWWKQISVQQLGNVISYMCWTACVGSRV